MTETWGNTVLKIVFKNEVFAQKYQIKVQSFFKGLLEQNEDFVITQVSSSLQEETTEIKKSVGSNNKVPLYSHTFDGILHCDEPEIEEDVTENKAQGLTCFNCLGNHHMKECPEKIDGLRVSANRKELLVNQSSSRYHEEEMKNMLKPGCLSCELRSALGLKGNQLPKFIYNMRVIGYPPGWMTEAELKTSGIAMYDGTGKALPDNHTGAEDKSKYDSTKFVDYPGFNSPVPDGFKDEWKELGMVKIQNHQQLNEFIKSNNTPPVASRQQPSVPLNNNTQKRKLFLPPPSQGISTQNGNGTNNADNSFSDWSPDESSTPKQNRSELGESSPLQRSLSASLSKSPGTPILNHGNRFERLPNIGNFSEGITEHLPFENLPDSVGKFEKMRGILIDVHKRLKHMKNES